MDLLKKVYKELVLYQQNVKVLQEGQLNILVSTILEITAVQIL